MKRWITYISITAKIKYIRRTFHVIFRSKRMNQMLTYNSAEVFHCRIVIFIFMLKIEIIIYEVNPFQFHIRAPLTHFFFWLTNQPSTLYCTK